VPGLVDRRFENDYAFHMCRFGKSRVFRLHAMDHSGCPDATADAHGRVCGRRRRRWRRWRGLTHSNMAYAVIPLPGNSIWLHDQGCDVRTPPSPVLVRRMQWSSAGLVVSRRTGRVGPQSMDHDGAPVVLTIARQLACGGSYIGFAVARRLRLTFLDREILRRAAAMLRVEDPRSLESLEESRAGLWARLSRGLSIGAPDAPFVPAPFRIDEEELFEVERRIITAVADHEDAVIVGHGAAWVLRDHPGAIRALIHAPTPWRIAAAQRTHHLDSEAARRLVERSDARRSRFIERLAGASWTDASLYDVAIDTSVVDMRVAIDWLADLMRSRLQRREPVSHAES
jgi:cytidylate kinase